MTLSPLLSAIRALSAEFARRVYIPVVSITSGAVVVLLGISIFLTTMSGWWWFLLVPVILLTLVFIVISIMTAVIITALRPEQTTTQKREVRSFVDSLQTTSEVVQTPKLILIIRLTYDVFKPSEKNFINEVSSTVVSLRPRFKAIVDSFK